MTGLEHYTTAELAALLAFYAEAGVDTPLADLPIDRFAEPEPARPSRPAPAAASAPAPARPQAAAARSEKPAPRAAVAPADLAIPSAEAVEKAREAAAAADSLPALKAAIERFDHCNLRYSAMTTVFAEGDPASGIMIVGSVPTGEDDKDGRPFAGRPGALLERMLAAIGLTREAVLLTTALPWRPAGGGPPPPAVSDICRPFLERQIELAAPAALLLLGNYAARLLIDQQSSIDLLRGEWRDIRIGAATVPALASYHPQDLMLAPLNKALAWRDLQTFRRHIAALGLA